MSNDTQNHDSPESIDIIDVPIVEERPQTESESTHISGGDDTMRGFIMIGFGLAMLLLGKFLFWVFAALAITQAVILLFNKKTNPSIIEIGGKMTGWLQDVLAFSIGKTTTLPAPFKSKKDNSVS